jgi:hypothetical protein
MKVYLVRGVWLEEVVVVAANDEGEALELSGKKPIPRLEGNPSFEVFADELVGVQCGGEPRLMKQA